MLGRGLESLIPKKNSEAKLSSKDAVDSPQRDESPLDSQPRSSDAPSAVGDQARSASETLSQTTFSRPQRKAVAEAIFNIEVEKIKPNPHQPRRDFDEESLKELAASIR